MSEFRKAQNWSRHDAWGDVATRIVDDEGRTFHRQFVQDIAPIVDQNTRERNEGVNAPRGEIGARKVGSIPVTVVYEKMREWEREGRLDKTDPLWSQRLNALLKDLLRDRDYAKFRTTEKV